MPSLSLDVLDTQGEAPKHRLSSPSSAFSLLNQLLLADVPSSKDRSRINAMINGAKPFDQQYLDDNDMADAANLNYGDAFAMVDQAVKNYFDLIYSVPTLMTLNVGYGDDSQRSVYAAKICKHLTKTIRKWPAFSFRFQKLVLQIIKHGVGFLLFPDEVDWKFEVAGLETFKLPRDTEATEDCVTVAVCTVPYTMSKLYSHIKDASQDDEANHWNIEYVKMLLKHANISNSKNQTDNWEALESALKQNDIYFSAGTSELIYLTHMWVKEFDGTVSHYIIPKAGDPIMPGLNIADKDPDCSNFLYAFTNKYKKMSEAFIMFAYDIGDGYVHSIRGLGYKIFPYCQLANNVRNIAVDSAVDSSRTLVQIKTESQSDVDRLVIKKYGQLAVLPPGVEWIDRNHPDFTKNLTPVLAEIANSMHNNTASYSIRGIQGGQGGPKSAAEINSDNMKESVLSSSALSLFYDSWGRALEQIVLRLCNENYLPCDQGYEEQLELKKALLADGVPMEAFYSVKDVIPMRSAGAGSAVQRQQNFNEAMNFMSFFDDTGKYSIVRDKLSELLGGEQVSRYMPESSASQRTPMDAAVAQLENFAMENGKPITPRSEDNHFVHGAIHFADVDSIVAALEQDQTLLQKTVQTLMILVPHIQFHVQQMDTKNGARKEEVREFKKKLQNVAASTVRLQNELKAAVENQQAQQQAEEKRQQDAMQAHVADLEKQQAEAKNGSDPAAQARLQQEIERYQVKTQIIQHEAELRLAVKRQEAVQNLQSRKAELALKQLAMTGVKNSDEAGMVY